MGRRLGSRSGTRPGGLGTDAAARSRVLAILVALLLAACGGSGSAPGLDRETFIEVFVELRARALQAPDGQLDPATRDAVLAEFEVTQEELRSFVEDRGDEPGVMLETWTEIRNRLEARSNAPGPEAPGPDPGDAREGASAPGPGAG